MVYVGIDEDAKEVANHSFRYTATNNANTPGFKRLRIGKQELLSTEIPTTSVTRIGFGASVLNFRGWENPSLGSGHVGVYLQAEMAKVRISMPLEHTNSMLNSSKSLLGTGDCKLDHGRSLLRAQLVLVTLVGIDDAKFHGEVAFTSGLDERKIPKLKADVVFLDEVVIDGDVLSRIVLTVLQREHKVLCMHTLTGKVSVTRILQEREALDGIFIVLVSAFENWMVCTHNPFYRLACHGV
jgi:hypothetical protein